MTTEPTFYIGNAEQKILVDEAMNKGAMPVVAYRKDGQWYYRYAFGCGYCGVIHRGGGGTGKFPDLFLGESGSWSLDCVGDQLGRPDATFVLAEIEGPLG